MIPADFIYGQAQIVQPANNLLDVVCAQSETIGKLFRRKPQMVVRRSRVLLLLNERIQIGLLLVRRLEEHRDVLDPREWGDHTLVILRLRQRMYVPPDNEPR